MSDQSKRRCGPGFDEDDSNPHSSSSSHPKMGDKHQSGISEEERERSSDRGGGGGDNRRGSQGRKDHDDKQHASRQSYHGYGDRKRSGSPSNRRGASNRDNRRRGGGGDHYKRSRSRSRERRRNSSERDHHSRKRTTDERQRSNSPRDRRNSVRSRDRPRYRKRPQSHSQSRSPDYCRSRPLMGATQKTANSLIASAPKQNAEDSKRGTENFVSESPNNLPLKDPMQLVRSGHIVTAQMAVQQTMAAMSARAQQLTGVQLPKYYNPAAVNPLKYAEQMQKRKLLWHNKEKKETVAPSTNNWESTTFSQDQDGKMAAKFKKLMGIKEEERIAATKAAESDPSLQDHIRKQEELFRTLDQQYEVARISTHTQRGVGLGFSSAAPIQLPHIFPK